ncbi:MAG: Rid family detoxifying hydrolase [bacterium]|jgi:2-iminobutanoate/2-iminopropanoate deaminase
MRQVVCTDKAPKSVNPLSQAIKAGDFVFVSGQLGKNLATGQLGEGMAEQTKFCLENMKNILEAAGSSLDNVVKVTIFVSDLDQVKILNEVYGQYFSKEPPARLCVEVSRLAQGALVEMDAVALLK